MVDKKEQIITPKGIVGPYPAIDRVDFGTDQYPDVDGSYKCEVRLDKTTEPVKALIKKFDSMVPAIEKEAEAFKKKMLKTKGEKVDITVNPLYRNVFDEDGEPTNLIAVKAKTKASGVNKKTNETWERNLPIRDSKGSLIKAKLGISTGSTVKIAMTIGDIYVNPKAGAGRAFYLDSVMLYDLVQYGGSNPFGEEDMEDGGYEYDPTDVQEETKEPANAFEEDDNDEEPDFAS
jgi:hypothetical protein